jgi:hypothetical protein
MMGYSGRTSPQPREAYAAGRFPYRDLAPGEIEISSRGWAQAYFSDRGLLALRGGVITAHLSQDRLESMQNAPTHVRQLHKHAPDTLGDEERYGVVKRPNPENASREIYVKTELEGGDERFAREYRRDLKPGGGAPNILVEHVEGDVVDQEGEVENLAMTGKPLRARSRYYTPQENTLTISIDEEGNFQIQLPDDAEEGGRMSIPEGGLRITVKKDIELNTEQNIAGAAERKVTFDGERGIELTFTGARVVQGGTVNTDSVVTCNSICPFLGGNHISGSARVAAEKGVPLVPTP